MRKLGFSLLVLLAIGGAYAARAEGSAGSPDEAKALAVQPEDRILGKPDAPITIIEYASLTCSHCAKFAVNVLPKLKEKWVETGKAKLIMRDYPLDERAMRAAMVTRCAPPERYYPFAEMFFAQPELRVSGSDYLAVLEKLVKLCALSRHPFA